MKHASLEIPTRLAGLTLLVWLLGWGSASAQTGPIERAKATDTALSCTQILAESADMDAIVAQARAAETKGNATAVAGTVGKVGAEVAERTGLFGKIGGLGGALFGKVAAKAAAGSAQESGNADAQEAAERAKQAAARKETLTQLAQTKACAAATASGAVALASPPGAPSAPPPEAAVSAEDVVLPDLNPAEWFDGKMGGTFGEKTVNAFGRSNRVAIAGFRVVFVTHNEASAITQATYMPGRETGTAKFKVLVDLKGVDDATLQAITNAAYQRFVAQLRAAGKEVLEPDQLQASLATFETKPIPAEVNQGKLQGRAFSPSGLPLWWQVTDPWGDQGLSQANMRAFNELSKASNAIAIAPSIAIDFASMSSSGNRMGYGSTSASASASLAMSVASFGTRVVRAEETRYGGVVFKGDDGFLAMSRRLDTDLQFAELLQVEENNKGSVMSLLGALGANSKQSIKMAKTSNAAYSKAANAVLSQATGTFAKLFTANPAPK